MTNATLESTAASDGLTTFDTHPDRYNHWRMRFDGAIATLSLDVDEERGLRPGYRLKLNSYDLGVDIELHDAIQRIRFEHPEIKCVVLTSARERMFSSGANIYMLGLSSHAWKVNFCKFTNETRNGMEDSSRFDGIKFLAAVNGTAAGGGYELALACDEIVMIDDHSSTVSLPEVPLLGVLPGTGGLTRLTDKRRVRRDLADVFCSSADGVRADRAQQWRLVDHVAKPQEFQAIVQRRAAALAAQSTRVANAPAVDLAPITRSIDAGGYRYNHVDVSIDRSARAATLTVQGPRGVQPQSIAEIHVAGSAWWPLAFARELDDAILMLRANDVEVGLWILKSEGDTDAVLAMDATLEAYASDNFVRETVGLLRRTFARLDVSSRTLFAIIDHGSCFAGTLLELMLAADRSYMLLSDDPAQAPHIALSPMNFGAYPMPNRQTRIATRFCGEDLPVEAARAAIGDLLPAEIAQNLGLVTFTPDDIDWADEVRIAIEERTSLSPDALTGMEASLRFPGTETMETRIFARLTAWQNWVFTRPNAVGEHGTLKIFGTGTKPRFNWERV